MRSRLHAGTVSDERRVPVNPQRRPAGGRSAGALAGRVSLLAIVLLTVSGCQLSRSFFQMDSNSRVPFFGVDLAPSWPKRGSSVEGVSRLQSEPRATPPPEAAPLASEQASLALPLTDSVSTPASTQSGPVEQFR